MSTHFDPWALAETHSRLSRTLSAAELPRLTSEVARVLSPVQVELAGTADKTGHRVLEGCLRASLEVTCQRCLEPMVVDIGAEPKLALFESEGALETLTGNFDPLVVARGELLSLAELVSDELLLALPLAPAHDLGSIDSTKCLTAEDQNAYFGTADQRQKPFADLAQLLNSKQTKLEE